jgi:hypothetical protein
MAHSLIREIMIGTPERDRTAIFRSRVGDLDH